ncbi:diguanylate cyclase [Oceanicella sp. SM1341]|uniref:GGDEF domain-containing protein n=1 Tax=Oceanicella sp. SM1341 TaxID=1548889 RepID=UPI001300B4A3|nr:GGDEF domain-containing protein [Oceanicella sp. SM1341]
MFARLQNASLRTWIAAGVLLAVAPLYLCMATGYFIFRDTVAEPFRQVIHAQHRIMLPLEKLQGELWHLSVAVNGYAETGDIALRRSMEDIERQIAAHLVELERAAEDFGQFSPILQGARQQWEEVIASSTAISPGNPGTADAALLRFEEVVAGVALRLEDVLTELRRENEDSHADALEAIRALEIGAGIASVLTVLLTFAGARIINRALKASTDELVAGAMRMASGERGGRIDVQIPPELAAVAGAFNTLAGRVAEQESELRALAGTDDLTGLGNRREFNRALASEADRAQATGGSFAVLLVDVDHFKRVNDAHGHPAGDEVLREISRQIAEAARAQDRVFRYGGEEFALLLRDVRETEAHAIAERMRTRIEAHQILLPGGARVSVSISVGIAVNGGAAGQHEKLLHIADTALYQAKSSGRNQVAMGSSVQG